MWRLLLFPMVILCQSGLASAAEPSKLVQWSTPFPGRALHSQVLILDGTLLYAVGGNASPAPHDFSEEAFVDEAFVFDIGQQNVKRLPRLPVALQSGGGAANPQSGERRSIVTMGGMGHVDGQFQALRDVYEYLPGEEQWVRLEPRLPAPRSMFVAATFDDAVWMFGGSAVGEKRRLAEDVLHWWGDDSAIAPLANVTNPVPRRSFGGAVLKDEFYMVGGLDGAGGIAATVSVFNFADRAWREAPAPRVARVFPSLTAMYDRLYLYGGFARTEDGHFAPAPSLETFDPKTGEWTTVAESLPGLEPSMTMLTLNRRLLFYGIDGQAKQAKLALFDPNPREKPAVLSPPNFGGSRPSEDGAHRNARLLMRKDADKDGRLSREELGARLAGLFRKADVDQNGFVTFAEAAAALQGLPADDQPGEVD